VFVLPADRVLEREKKNSEMSGNIGTFEVTLKSEIEETKSSRLMPKKADKAWLFEN
jgi:hypothetical protein